MNKTKIFKVLIPIVAVVVIFESVLLISNLNKQEKGSVQNIPLTNKTEEIVPVLADFVFEVSDKAMKVGERYSVGLNLMPKKDLQIDSFEIFVKYDPKMFEVSDLTSNTELGKSTSAKVNQKQGLIVTTIYIAQPNGFGVKTEQLLNLINFSVKPLGQGESFFEVNTGNESADSATMLVENGKATAIPYSTNKLVIKVSK